MKNKQINVYDLNQTEFDTLIKKQESDLARMKKEGARVWDLMSKNRLIDSLCSIYQQRFKPEWT